MNTLSVLTELADERARQDAKHGFPPLADGTSSDWPGQAAILELSRWANDNGQAQWSSVLLEEVAEAMLEEDPARIRAELVQVAAVAVKWIEDIDRRGK